MIPSPRRPVSLLTQRDDILFSDDDHPEASTTDEEALASRLAAQPTIFNVPRYREATERRSRGGQENRERDSSSSQDEKEERSPGRPSSRRREAQPPSTQLLKGTASSKPKRRGKADGGSHKAVDTAHYRDGGMLEVDRERLQRALKNQVGVEAGVRMHHMAVGQQHRRKEEEKKKKHDASAAEHDDAVDPKDYPFKPTLSEGTKKQFQGPYQGPAERFDALAQREAKQKILREHEAEQQLEEECTFHPSITKISDALAQRRRSASAEPSFAGSRLYADAVERSQRHHLMKSEVNATENRERVGGERRLKPEDVEAMVSRFRHWQQQQQLNKEQVLRETLRTTQWRNRRRSSSADVEGLYKRLQHTPQEGDMMGTTHPLRGRSSSVVQPSNSSPLPQSRNERSAAMAEEMRQIRFRALFAKYQTKQQPTITLHSVKTQVRTLFPLDVGVVSALQRVAKNDEDEISKSMFVKALTVYERQYGPQSWGRLEHHRLHEEDTDSDDEGSRRRFQPRISEISKALASEKRSRKEKPIYELLLEQGSQKQKRHEALVAASNVDKMKDATFHPRVSERSKKLSEQQYVKKTKGVAHSSAAKSESSAQVTPKRPTTRNGRDESDILEQIERELTEGAPLQLASPSPSSTRGARAAKVVNNNQRTSPSAKASPGVAKRASTLVASPSLRADNDYYRAWMAQESLKLATPVSRSSAPQMPSSRPSPTLLRQSPAALTHGGDLWRQGPDTGTTLWSKQQSRAVALGLSSGAPPPTSRLCRQDDEGRASPRRHAAKKSPSHPYNQKSGSSAQKSAGTCSLRCRTGSPVHVDLRTPSRTTPHRSQRQQRSPRHSTTVPLFGALADDLLADVYNRVDAAQRRSTSDHRKGANAHIAPPTLSDRRAFR